MFYVLVMVLLLITLAFLFFVACGTGTDRPTDTFKPLPLDGLPTIKDYTIR